MEYPVPYTCEEWKYTIVEIKITVVKIAIKLAIIFGTCIFSKKLVIGSNRIANKIANVKGAIMFLPM